MSDDERPVSRRRPLVTRPAKRNLAAEIEESPPSQKPAAGKPADEKPATQRPTSPPATERPSKSAQPPAADDDVVRSAPEPPSPRESEAAADEQPPSDRPVRKRPTNPWARFLVRLADLLLRPTTFWSDVVREDVSVKEMMFPHLLVLVGFRAFAGLVGQLLGDATLLASLGGFVTSFVSWFAMVWVFAILAASLASTRGARLAVHDSVRFAVYGLTPLFAVGVFAAIPLPHVAPVAELLAMPWAFYVLSVGIVPSLGVPVKRAPGLAGQLCGAALILWSVMPTLLPQLVSALTR